MLALSLVALEKNVKKGAAPRFQLTIQNSGSEAERLIDLRDGRRRDLQHTYYDLEVSEGGKPLLLPRAISDPGPISDDDFTTLKPGEAVTFGLSRFPFMLEVLPPGQYQARVRVRQDPFQSTQADSFSPYAEFTVEE